MGVELDGDADLLLQRGDQLLGGVGLQHAGHILDAQHVGATALQLLGQIDVVVQRIFVPGGIQNIAGIADGSLTDLILLEDLLHGDLHAGQPVERVEHAEDIDAAAGGLLDELPDDVIGIVGVTHGVGAADEHLQQHVGGLFPDHIQTLPGGLVEETVGHIEGGAAPALQREGIAQNLAGGLHAPDDVPGADAGGQQGLLTVAGGGVADEELLLILHPVAHSLGALGVQQRLEALGTDTGDRRGTGILVQLVAALLLDGDAADVLEHLGGAVLALLQLKQFRRLVDELGVALAGNEGGIFQDVGDEGDVGLHAADVDFVDGAGGLAADGLEGIVPGGDLDQQRVVIGRDDGTGVGVAAVQTDAEAAGGAVGGDLTGVGSEVVGGVLGGDAALEGIAVQLHALLAGDADLRIAEGTALGDEDLGADDVDARHHLGDGVLHLNAGVHLNEVVVEVPVHQEFQRAGVDIAHVLGDLHRVGADGLADRLGHGEGGSELHHLLVAALERAVTLVEVGHVAVLIAQDLHLDVLGLHQELLHENIVVAEGLLGLGLHQIEVDAHFLHGVAPAHAAATAAAGCLEDDGEAKLHRKALGLLPAGEGLLGAGGGGHAALDGHLLGRELVAHHVQHPGVGADELDAGGFAGPGQITVFRQETVAGVDGVGAVLFGQMDDAGNIQISAQRAFVLTNQVGLVGRCAEQAVSIFIGIDGDGLQAQIVAGTENTHGDLAAVGYQHLLKRSAHVGVPPSPACGQGNLIILFSIRHPLRPLQRFPRRFCIFGTDTSFWQGPPMAFVYFSGTPVLVPRPADSKKRALLTAAPFGDINSCSWNPQPRGERPRRRRKPWRPCPRRCADGRTRSGSPHRGRPGPACRESSPEWPRGSSCRSSRCAGRSRRGSRQRPAWRRLPWHTRQHAR